MHARDDEGWSRVKNCRKWKVVVLFEAGGLDAIVEGEFKDRAMPTGPSSGEPNALLGEVSRTSRMCQRCCSQAGDVDQCGLKPCQAR